MKKVISGSGAKTVLHSTLLIIAVLLMTMCFLCLSASAVDAGATKDDYYYIVGTHGSVTVISRYTAADGTTKQYDTLGTYTKLGTTAITGSALKAIVDSGASAPTVHYCGAFDTATGLASGSFENYGCVPYFRTLSWTLTGSYKGGSANTSGTGTISTGTLTVVGEPVYEYYLTRSTQNANNFDLRGLYHLTNGKYEVYTLAENKGLGKYSTVSDAVLYTLYTDRENAGSGGCKIYLGNDFVPQERDTVKPSVSGVLDHGFRTVTGTSNYTLCFTQMSGVKLFGSYRGQVTSMNTTVDMSGMTAYYGVARYLVYNDPNDSGRGRVLAIVQNTDGTESAGHSYKMNSTSGEPKIYDFGEYETYYSRNTVPDLTVCFGNSLTADGLNVTGAFNNVFGDNWPSSSDFSFTPKTVLGAARGSLKGSFDSANTDGFTGMVPEAVYVWNINEGGNNFRAVAGYSDGIAFPLTSAGSDFLINETAAFEDEIIRWAQTVAGSMPVIRFGATNTGTYDATTNTWSNVGVTGSCDMGGKTICCDYSAVISGKLSNVYFRQNGTTKFIIRDATIDNSSHATDSVTFRLEDDGIVWFDNSTVTTGGILASSFDNNARWKTFLYISDCDITVGGEYAVTTDANHNDVASVYLWGDVSIEGATRAAIRRHDVYADSSLKYGLNIFMYDPDSLYQDSYGNIRYSRHLTSKGITAELTGYAAAAGKKLAYGANGTGVSALSSESIVITNIDFIGGLNVSYYYINIVEATKLYFKTSATADPVFLGKYSDSATLYAKYFKDYVIEGVNRVNRLYAIESTAAKIYLNGEHLGFLSQYAGVASASGIGRDITFTGVYAPADYVHWVTKNAYGYYEVYGLVTQLDGKKQIYSLTAFEGTNGSPTIDPALALAVSDRTGITYETHKIVFGSSLNKNANNIYDPTISGTLNLGTGYIEWKTPMRVTFSGAVSSALADNTLGTLVLDAMTITLGGLTLENMTISNTSTGSGSAIYLKRGKLTVSNSAVSAAGTTGIAVFNAGGNLTIDNSTVSSAGISALRSFVSGSTTGITGGSVIECTGTATEVFAVEVFAGTVSITNSTLRIGSGAGNASACLNVTGGSGNLCKVDVSGGYLTAAGSGSAVYISGNMNNSEKYVKLKGGVSVTAAGNHTILVDSSYGTPLLIENAAVENTGTGQFAAIKNQNTSSITISGGTVTGNGNYHAVYYTSPSDRSTLTVSGGRVTNGGSVADINTIYNSMAGTVNITNGTVSYTGTGSRCYSIYNNGAGTVNISGGAVSSTKSAILNKTTGKLDISGGEVSGASMRNAITQNGAGTLIVRGSAVVHSDGYTVIGVANGTMEVGGTARIYADVNEEDSCDFVIEFNGTSLSISGGEITAPTSGYCAISTGSNTNLTISGGTITGNSTQPYYPVIDYRGVGDAKLTMTGGTVTSTGSGGGTICCYTEENDLCEVLIGGGTLNGQFYLQYTDTTISGGTVNGTVGLNYKGKLTISGGIINGRVDNSGANADAALTVSGTAELKKGILLGNNPLIISGGTVTNDVGCTLDGSDRVNAAITISGGTVTNAGGYDVIYLNPISTVAAPAFTVGISGGNITAGATGKAITANGGNKLTLNISGGTVSGGLSLSNRTALNVSGTASLSGLVALDWSFMTVSGGGVTASASETVTLTNTATLTVNGGAVSNTGSFDTVVCNPGSISDTLPLLVTGGSITASAGRYAVVTNNVSPGDARNPNEMADITIDIQDGNVGNINANGAVITVSGGTVGDIRLRYTETGGIGLSHSSCTLSGTPEVGNIYVYGAVSGSSYLYGSATTTSGTVMYTGEPVNVIYGDDNTGLTAGFALINAAGSADATAYFFNDKYALSFSRNALVTVDRNDNNLALYAITLSLEDNIDLNIYLRDTAAAGYDSFYLKATFKDKVYILRNGTAAERWGMQLIHFSFEGIAAKEIGDDITLVLCGIKNDEVYTGKRVEYSVKKYCMNQLNSAAQPASFKALCADLLNYGAAAQQLFSYNTARLANADMTDTHRAFATVQTPALTSYTGHVNTMESPAITFHSVTLLLENAVNMNFYFTTELQDLSAIDFKVWKDFNNDGVEDTGEISWIYGADYEFGSAVVGGVSCRSVIVEGIAAKNMRTKVYITAYENETAVSRTLRYSIESYAKSKLTDPNAAIADLVVALMKYSDAAKTYFSGLS